MKSGLFKDEIIPVAVPGRKGAVLVSQDEFPKPDTTFEGLSALKPAFIRDGSGTVTAGNASGINDGAAALVLASSAFAKQHGLKSLATIKGYGWVGVDPDIMGIGPVPAVQAAVSLTKLTPTE